MDDDQLQQLLWDDGGEDQQEEEEQDDAQRHPLEDELDAQAADDGQEEGTQEQAKPQPQRQQQQQQQQQRQQPGETSGRPPATGNMAARGGPATAGRGGPGNMPQPTKQSQELEIRYFIIRSNSQDNIDISVQMGAWATLKFNEEKLDNAFNTCDEVRLLFSVNTSQCFQGYAVMRTPVGQYNGRVIWSNGQPFGNPFAVEWKCLFNLKYDQVSSMRNPLNDNMPVTKARDCQELPANLGNKIVDIMEQAARQAGAPPPPKASAAAAGAAAGRGRGGRSGPDMGGRGIAGGRGGRGDFGRGRGGMPMPMGGPGMGPGPGMMGMGPMGGMNPMAAAAMMGGNPMMMGGGMGAMGGGVNPMGMGMPGNAMGRGMGGMGGGMGPGRMGMQGMGMDDVLEGEHTRSPSRGRQQGMGVGMGGMRERSRSPVRPAMGSIAALKQQQQEAQRMREERDARMRESRMPLQRDQPPQQQQQQRQQQSQQRQLAAGGMGLPDTSSNHPDLLSLPYDQYLDYYRKLQRKMEGMKEAQRGPSQQQASQPTGMMGPVGASTASNMERPMGMGGMGDRMREPTPPTANPAMLMMQQQQQQQAAAMAAMGMGIPGAMAAGGMMGGMNPMMMAAGMGGGGMMGGVNPMMAAAAAGAGMMMGGPGMMAPGGMMGGMMGMQQNMQLTEAEYIQRTIQHFRSHGQEPPSEVFIRQHYRKEREALMGGGMRM